MSIKADFHLHSSFSGDSTAPMEEMIKQAISLGLTYLCFTEHNDFDYPTPPGNKESVQENVFLVNTDSYLYDFIRFREQYKDQIQLLFGVELGLQPHLLRENAVYARSYDFDFIIASSHVCDHRDPYYPPFYEGRSEEEAYRSYFNSIIENVRKFDNYDIYGHLDYVVRYGPSRDKDYSYEKYKDLFDTMLSLLIGNGKGIEVNTGGYRKGLKELHPCTDVLKRYRELGGEIITVGSDAHEPGHIGADFEVAAQILKECGFQYYTIFRGRQPEFIRL